MDSHQVRDALRHGHPIVLDGGLATQLEAQGSDLSDSLWSARLLVEEPEAIVAAHLAFYRAGATVATTASYQATFEGFAKRGLDRAAALGLLRRSVELAERAKARALDEGAAGPLFVAASIGPYGAMLADGSEYRGNYGLSVTELADFHRTRLRALASTAADVLAVETIPELEEAVAVAGLLGELPGTAAWISFSCADGARIRGGAPIEEAVEAVRDAPGVVAVGVNCTAPEHVDELLARIRATTSLPIAVYPNSGEGWDAVERRWTGTGPGRVDGEAATRWVAAGASLVGGCCRVGPSQIGAMASALAVAPRAEA
ncbi:MAG TPA: homocysteine S-methyltransferase [Candidatus Limnocylindrales bacterium]|nr:homocysteine S-methyltransferase [Candidatus Limnocylindrales bacterium]